MGSTHPVGVSAVGVGRCSSRFRSTPELESYLRSVRTKTGYREDGIHQFGFQNNRDQVSFLEECVPNVSQEGWPVAGHLCREVSCYVPNDPFC